MPTNCPGCGHPMHGVGRGGGGGAARGGGGGGPHGAAAFAPHGGGGHPGMVPARIGRPLVRGGVPVHVAGFARPMGGHHGGPSGRPFFRGRRGIRFFGSGWWWWNGAAWAVYTGAQCTSWGPPLRPVPADLLAEANAQVTANGGNPVVETWTNGVTYLFSAGGVVRPCASVGYALSGSPVASQPAQNGAGRGNYWADSLTDDNYVRSAATWWKDSVGLAGACNCTHPGCGCASTSTNSTRFPTECPEPAGPTDTTIRCAGEWWVQNVLPRDSAAGLGGVTTDEALMLGGRPVDGFGLGLNADPFDTQLNSAQQQWVLAALVVWLNNTPTYGCAGLSQGAQVTVPQNRVIAVMCFQAWWNAGGLIGSPPAALNQAGAIIAVGEAGAVTQDTIGTLGQVMTVAPYASSSPGTYPSTTTQPAGMSKGAKVALGVGAAAVVIGTGLAISGRRKRSAA